MKAKAKIKRTYTKEVEVEFEYSPGLDPIQSATDQVLYTQKVEELLNQAPLREIDDNITSASWEEAGGQFITELNKYGY